MHRFFDYFFILPGETEMGIFDIFKKKNYNIHDEVEREMYEKKLNGYRDFKDSLDYQNKLLDRVNSAQQRYKQDGNLEAVIKELEYAFVEADPPCKTSQVMDLAKYYVKAEQNDKAWRYLNRLIIKRQADIESIRFAQAGILKKEKKWAEAVEMYMLGYLEESKRLGTFRKEKFVKDIKSSSNKLEWDDQTINQVSQIFEKQTKKKNYDEQQLRQEFRKFYSSLE